MPFTATSAPFQSHGLSYTSQPHFLAWLVLVLVPVLSDPAPSTKLFLLPLCLLLCAPRSPPGPCPSARRNPLLFFLFLSVFSLD